MNPAEPMSLRLLRVQMWLEDYDEHAEHCSCEYCKAVDLVRLLQAEQRDAERQAA